MNRWTDKDPWILVMNATRARILRGLQKPGRPVPAELVVRSEARHLRDIMSDKPGRSFASTGGGRRSGMEYGSDPVQEDARAFVREISTLLETHRRAGDFDQLVIFAAPPVMGMLREMLPPSILDLVEREVPKNLVPLSEADLAERVLDELKSP